MVTPRSFSSGSHAVAHTRTLPLPRLQRTTVYISRLHTHTHLPHCGYTYCNTCGYGSTCGCGYAHTYLRSHTAVTQLLHTLPRGWFLPAYSFAGCYPRLHRLRFQLVWNILYTYFPVRGSCGCQRTRTGRYALPFTSRPLRAARIPAPHHAALRISRSVPATDTCPVITTFGSRLYATRGYTRSTSCTRIYVVCRTAWTFYYRCTLLFLRFYLLVEHGYRAAFAVAFCLPRSCYTTFCSSRFYRSCLPFHLPFYRSLHVRITHPVTRRTGLVPARMRFTWMRLVAHTLRTVGWFFRLGYRYTRSFTVRCGYYCHLHCVWILYWLYLVPVHICGYRTVTYGLLRHCRAVAFTGWLVAARSHAVTVCYARLPCHTATFAHGSHTHCLRLPCSSARCLRLPARSRALRLPRLVTHYRYATSPHTRFLRYPGLRSRLRTLPCCAHVWFWFAYLYIAHTVGYTVTFTALPAFGCVRLWVPATYGYGSAGCIHHAPVTLLPLHYAYRCGCHRSLPPVLPPFWLVRDFTALGLLRSHAFTRLPRTHVYAHARLVLHRFVRLLRLFTVACVLPPRTVYSSAYAHTTPHTTVRLPFTHTPAALRSRSRTTHARGLRAFGLLVTGTYYHLSGL